MKTKILFFILGITFSLIILIVYSVITNPYTTSIHYPKIEKSYAFMDYLYENNIRYSCEVDPLMRLRVTPYIKNVEERKVHEKVFHEEYESHKISTK